MYTRQCKQNTFMNQSKTNSSTITNILLIDNTVEQYEQFYYNCNKNTLPIIYNHLSNPDELFTVLTSNFKSIDRLCFVFDEKICIDNNNKFINNEPFFTDEDLTKTNIDNMSSNVKLIVNLCKKLNVKCVDYLACNSLKYSKWTNYYNKINMLTNGVIVGASANKTGNTNYGGDWMLESINLDVKLIYFTDGIINYTLTLGTTIDSTVLGNYADVNGYFYTTIVQNNDGSYYFIGEDPDTGNPLNYDCTFPVLIASTVQVTIKSLTITDANTYFICGANGIQFIGDTDAIITVTNVSGYPGLIQNGSIDANGDIQNVLPIGTEDNPLNPSNNIIVKSINMHIINSSLFTDRLNNTCGWVCQNYFGCATFNPLYQYVPTSVVQNCSSDGPIGVNNITENGPSGGGGILGDYSWADIINCTNSGEIGYLGGGIFGKYAFSIPNVTNTTSFRVNAITIDSSTNNGVVGYQAGGIFGAYLSTNSTNSIFNISNCINNGLIGYQAGGICGAYLNANSINSEFSLSGCKNNGKLSYITDSGYLIGVNANYNTTNSAIIYNSNDVIFNYNIFSLPCFDLIYASVAKYNNHVNETLPVKLITPSISISQDNNILIQTAHMWTLSNNSQLLNPVSFPFTIPENTTFSFDTNITIGTGTPYGAKTYFICGGDNITILGNNKTFTINNISNYPGLIQNGKSNQMYGRVFSISNVYNNILIQDIILYTLGTCTLGNDTSCTSGWICQNYFGYGSGQCSITNCISSGPISSSIPISDGYGGGGGGILGDYSWANSVTNCANYGAIGPNGGGIFGSCAFAINNVSVPVSTTLSATITSCTNYSPISGGGGIFGSLANYQTTNSTINVISAVNSNTGLINDGGGGIFGPYANSTTTNGVIYIYEASNKGDIGGGSGGLFGNYASYYTSNSIININGYFNEGAIGYDAGGIFGPYFGIGIGVQGTIKFYGFMAPGDANHIGFASPGAGNIYFNYNPVDRTVFNLFGPNFTANVYLNEVLTLPLNFKSLGTFVGNSSVKSTSIPIKNNITNINNSRTLISLDTIQYATRFSLAPEPTLKTSVYLLENIAGKHAITIKIKNNNNKKILIPIVPQTFFLLLWNADTKQWSVDNIQNIPSSNFYNYDTFIGGDIKTPTQIPIVNDIKNVNNLQIKINLNGTYRESYFSLLPDPTLNSGIYILENTTKHRIGVQIINKNNKKKIISIPANERFMMLWNSVTKVWSLNSV